MLELWDGSSIVTLRVAAAAPRASREAANLQALLSDHVLFERDRLTRGDQHIEVDREIRWVTDFDLVCAFFESKSLREPIEVIDQANVVAIDEYLGVARLHLETE